MSEIKELDERIRDLESTVTEHSAQIGEVNRIASAHVSSCPSSDLYTKHETTNNKIETTRKDLSDKIDGVKKELDTKIDSVKKEHSDKIDNINTKLTTNISHVDSLRKFLIPLISIGNVLALSFLVIMISSANKQADHLSNKLDELVKENHSYQQSHLISESEHKAIEIRLEMLQKELEILRRK